MNTRSHRNRPPGMAVAPEIAGGPAEETRRPVWKRGATIVACIAILLSSSAGAAAAGLKVLAADGRDVGEDVQKQIRMAQEEKAARSPAQRKLDSQLLFAARRERGEPLIPGIPTVQTQVRLDQAKRARVQIKGAVTQDLLTEISRAHGVVLGIFAESEAVVALLPINEAENLARFATVRFIALAEDPTTNEGAANSEGNLAHAGDLARHRYCIDGAGVKVGVISDGVDSLANAQASGDLGPVTILPGQSGHVPGSSSDEGTAMLEIVHDLAPGAELFFATGFGSDQQMAQNITALRNAGCSIIVDDVSYANESPFQDGVISRAVNEVSAAGVLYFSSAANSGNKDSGTSSTWEGEFVDGGAAAIADCRVNDFGGLAYNYNPAGGNTRVDLFWNDPLGGSSNDYDLYLMDENGVMREASQNAQDGNDDPYERILRGHVGTRIFIAKHNAAATRFLHLETPRNPLQFSTEGSTHGHNASGAPNAFSVAAVPAAGGRTGGPNGPYPNAYNSGQTVEKFSSDGPRRIFFEADGTEITPGNRGPGGGRALNKPDITAADGVSTTTPGFAPFFGTSASAPHAAAIAALVKSMAPNLTPAQVRTALYNGAIDIHSTGFDRNSGFGIVVPEPALQALNPPPIYLYISDNSEEKCFAPEGSISLKPDPEFFITLNVPSSQPVTVHVKTQDDTARGTSGFNYDTTADYYAVDTDITFNPGETEKTVKAGSVCNQRLGRKTFFMNLSKAVGAQICDGQATGVLYDGNPNTLPALSVRDIQATEAESGDVTGGTVYAEFVVSLPEPADTYITVDFSTQDGTALSGKDYTARSGTLVFDPRQRHKTIAIEILDDGVRGEPDVEFFLNLSNAQKATIGRAQAKCTIHDLASPAQEHEVFVGSGSATEGNSGFVDCVFPIRLSSPSTNIVTVKYVTAPDTAKENEDFEPVGGTITFAPGDTNKAAVVRVVGDTVPEPNEQFYLILSNPTNASLGSSAGIGMILDDDGGATPTPSPTVGPTQQTQNISTRIGVGTGEYVAIGGFIIQGNAAKRVIIRGAGPSLANAVNGAMPDPTLELHDSAGTLLATNDDWKDFQQAEITASGVAPASDLESAMIVILSPGAYTAILRGYNDQTGIALVEVYDLDQAAGSRLANISTRGYVGTADYVLIGGFIVGQQGTFVIRAIGPSLAQSAVVNALSDPVLEFRDVQGTLIDSNDDWEQNPYAALVSNAGLAPTHVRESALIYQIPPGNFTAIVRGYNDAIGVGLIEVYNLQ